MTVRSLTKLAALIRESEANGTFLELRRVGFRRFVFSSPSVHWSKDSGSRWSGASSDFVYETGFVPEVEATGASRSFLRRSRVWFAVPSVLLVIAVTSYSFVNVMPSLQAKPEESGGNLNLIAGHHRDSNTSGPVAATSDPGTCLTSSMAALERQSNWDDTSKRFPKTWSVNSDVVLGGVEQIAVQPACEQLGHGYLLVNLVKAEGHWKLKNAAPEGPHF